ncbi:hypothetical protein THRCLA_05348 [Thraustotheca clavata]|uniref:JmjC domain-containing protein n=1 Tax=Thraustotheca clavata TaxID=74557 RepID=A0A1V9ZW67_9STRA|nr:hypothetical protein THRCLA_05348 [Thraustotheca clavata]
MLSAMTSEGLTLDKSGNAFRQMLHSDKYARLCVATDTPEENTTEILHETGFKEPILVANGEQSFPGLHCPTRTIDLDTIPLLIEHALIVKTIDRNTLRYRTLSKEEASQCTAISSPIAYWPYNVEFPIAETPLQLEVIPPDVVYDMDWFPRLEPRVMAATNPNTFVSVYGAYTYRDFTINACGASCWIQHLSGLPLWVYAVPPSTKAYEAFKKWQSNNPVGISFAHSLDTPCQKYEIGGKACLLIPPGWIYSLYVPQQSFSPVSVFLTGTYLHGIGLDRIAEVVRLEHELSSIVPNLPWQEQRWSLVTNSSQFTERAPSEKLGILSWSLGLQHWIWPSVQFYLDQLAAGQYVSSMELEQLGETFSLLQDLGHLQPMVPENAHLHCGWAVAAWTKPSISLLLNNVKRFLEQLGYLSRVESSPNINESPNMDSVNARKSISPKEKNQKAKHTGLGAHKKPSSTTNNNSTGDNKEAKSVPRKKALPYACKCRQKTCAVCRGCVAKHCTCPRPTYLKPRGLCKICMSKDCLCPNQPATHPNVSSQTLCNCNTLCCQKCNYCIETHCNCPPPILRRRNRNDLSSSPSTKRRKSTPLQEKSTNSMDKAALTELLNEVTVLSNKLRFALSVLDGSITIFNRKNKALVDDLKKKDFATVPDNSSGYDYLLTMPLGTFTAEKVEGLIDIVGKKRKMYQDLVTQQWKTSSTSLTTDSITVLDMDDNTENTDLPNTDDKSQKSAAEIIEAAMNKTTLVKK